MPTPDRFIEVWLDPDGVNGDVAVLGEYEGMEIRVIVTRGPEREVIHDTQVCSCGHGEDEHVDGRCLECAVANVGDESDVDPRHPFEREDA